MLYDTKMNENYRLLYNLNAISYYYDQLSRDSEMNYQSIRSCYNLISKPLPHLYSFQNVTLKTWEWPGDEDTEQTSQHLLYIMQNEIVT